MLSSHLNNDLNDELLELNIRLELGNLLELYYRIIETWYWTIR